MLVYCLIKVVFSGVGREIVLELFEKMATQEYKKPRFYVGMFPKNEELENEFALVKTYLHSIKYFTDMKPNLETLKLIGRLYKVSMEIQYEFPDELSCGMAKYDYETNKLTIFKKTQMDFIFYDFEDEFHLLR